MLRHLKSVNVDFIPLIVVVQQYIPIKKNGWHQKFTLFPSPQWTKHVQKQADVSIDNHMRYTQLDMVWTIHNENGVYFVSTPKQTEFNS